MSEELIDELVRLVAQYGMECADTKELAPRKALADMFGTLRHALTAAQAEGERLKQEREWAWAAIAGDAVIGNGSFDPLSREIRSLRSHLAAAEASPPVAEAGDFSAANRARCEAPSGFNHPLNSWSLSDWFTATMGELGEAANVAKKLNRVRDGIIGNKQTPEQLRAMLRSEVADAFIYLDLLAQSEGFDLMAAVAETFNRKSEEIGYPVRYDPSAAVRPETPA